MRAAHRLNLTRVRTDSLGAGEPRRYG